MSQSRTGSLIEQICNVGSGFIVSLIYWVLVVVPQVEGQEITIMMNLSITAQFTVISVLRGYLWRRFFNWLMVKREQKAAYGNHNIA